jgi:hypothetical protein
MNGAAMTLERLLKKTAVMLAAAILTPLLHANNGNAAQPAFRQLQRLVGDWQGKDQRGEPVRSYFSPIASKTAVMETISAGHDEMVSVYSMGANSIVLVHYCASNNQPRLRAVPSSGPIQELVFSFESAENLPSLAVGHERKLVIEFQDSDHITEHWTWCHDGKDTETVFHLARMHLSRN